MAALMGGFIFEFFVKPSYFYLDIYFMKKGLFLTLIVLLQLSAEAQKNGLIVSGPVLGHTELRSSQVWIELQQNVSLSQLSLSYTSLDGKERPVIVYPFKEENKFSHIYRFYLAQLEPNAAYAYKINYARKEIARGEVKTQSLWQWRTDAPDFSFIAGSCSYFNEPKYDRPNRPYGRDSSIFESMAKEKADFMLWLGDNWYTRDVDYYSVSGLNYRASRDRSLPVLQPFLKAMPHYAIWDDHDYGPNNSDKSYVLKEESRKVFMNYWSNPSYGHNNQGIYSKFTWNDADVFLLDDRWFRSNDDMPDSVNGTLDDNKCMYGAQQMEWLKNALLQSKTNATINFRIIATGSQVLNKVSLFDCFYHFTKEYKELMQFIADNKINGVLFVTGDRHHSEIIKVERSGAYPLYDITCSPLTSTIYKFDGPEKENPYRILGIDNKQNYTRFSFTGKGKDRRLTITYLDIKGEVISEWSVTKNDLSN